jgi:hypothetical protein
LQFFNHLLFGFGVLCAVPGSSALAMQNRRLLNLPIFRQEELRQQFPWLRELIEDERPDHVQVVSVTVFDHWLSRDEACALLENVPTFEQSRRDALHASFCKSLVATTEVLSFRFRGRRDDRLVFREFTSKDELARYCAPNGGRTLGHRQFQVALPELNCVYLESWDDTNHFFFTEPTAINYIQQLAEKSGLYVLSHG